MDCHFRDLPLICHYSCLGTLEIGQIPKLQSPPFWYCLSAQRSVMRIDADNTRTPLCKFCNNCFPVGKKKSIIVYCLVCLDTYLFYKKLDICWNLHINCVQSIDGLPIR